MFKRLKVGTVVINVSAQGRQNVRLLRLAFPEIEIAGQDKLNPK